MDNPIMDLTRNIAANLSAWMAGTPSLDTIKKVASRSGVGFGTVQRVRNGNGNPTITNLGDIARAFGRRVEDLIAEPQSGITMHVSEPAPPPYKARMDELRGSLTRSRAGRSQLGGKAHGLRLVVSHGVRLYHRDDHRFMQLPLFKGEANGTDQV